MFELTVDTLVDAIKSLFDQLHLAHGPFCCINCLRILLVTSLLQSKVINHPLFDGLQVVVFRHTLINFLVYLCNFLDELHLLLDHFSLVVFRWPNIIEEDIGVDLENKHFILEWWSYIGKWATFFFKNIVTFKTDQGSSSVNHLEDLLLDEVTVVTRSDILLSVKFTYRDDRNL